MILVGKRVAPKPPHNSDAQTVRDSIPTPSPDSLGKVIRVVGVSGSFPLVVGEEGGRGRVEFRETTGPG